ncbi:glycosyltransferase WbuB [Marinobacter vulgaris]|uniref:Glycosyltransferase WbuB n=1 Tax=Marinobacter vulgaris TaxID=1928331 RepID=A0A2V3ZUD0_9GAMM|nr:glycosyltransferase family 4 protein [Marinobacter vulgaris]PXX88894.1 glycosyltransferase WbuB [Marinobacter vulgaris]TSJ66675.1 glycosyltransferase family 4 protein [Marinobacter vulgaris]
MKVLLLTFYFKPDLSAGSFRNTAFVESLLKNLPEKSEIHVVTTLPNRYSGFSAEAREEEITPELTIKRVPLPAHEGGMVDQSRAFLTYAKAVRAFVKGQEYDVVFASSSRLMTAVLGALVAQKKDARLYLDIRDIFVDTIKDVLPRKLSWLIKPFFCAVERWTVLRSDRLNVVSAGFLPYFETRYPQIPKVVFTNGVDEEFLRLAPEAKTAESVTAKTPRKKLVEVVYAGNMGEGQGLHNIVPALAKRLEGRAVFRLIGGGGRLRQLQDAIVQAGCVNVTIEPPVARAELIQLYRQADVLFLHLNDYDAFRKVLPSKLFEYGALGKPIWAGVAGYAATFVRENLDNAEVFSPCDVAEALKAFEKLYMHDEPRESFVARFRRQAIMDEMARDLVAVGERRS